MTRQKLSRRRTLVRLTIIALALASQLDHATAQPPAFDRVDVEMAVNAKAPITVLDAENMRFAVERINMPRQERQVGFVCGRIIPVDRPRFGDAMNSYQALLFLRYGQLSAGPVAAFFKPLEELLNDKMCQ
ncbi:hypothetical protein [Phyllobacterium bourgognense]|uniref:Uncharacterized protein n=1 Tax=Phyllobacterium bourgognense TaxID=314236 RepID=A0A368Z6K7_9HYPH|nr:hypothetical protein [Phyllobacterium bourgognense]RCW87579.1 hypothetical protein C7476_101345 [Phyllobacterium bourgognense]